ncbi:dr1-associated corepressor isoform X2 [Microcaecilia unicolor]|uniref:Dr1-associated corepressor n=1 Tax=Microcaecilia unicolor TaxID=1415580 RepID=A0A6P7ZBP3_9AMPH|nr:dr1-associated corepressor isoform X2 [Microcaecilia unicolor]
MPSKKKKYNARFPPARIKKIMQTDEEIGKVAAAVPVIISRALELFLEALLKTACQVTQSRNAKTMTTSHLKQCIELEQQFDFLKDLVASVPDMQGDAEENNTEGEKVPRRGRKSGSGKKNGSTGMKGKDKKQSGTDSELEEESNKSEEDGEEETYQPATNQPTARFQRTSLKSCSLMMSQLVWTNFFFFWEGELFWSVLVASLIWNDPYVITCISILS